MLRLLLIVTLMFSSCTQETATNTTEDESTVTSGATGGSNSDQVDVDSAASAVGRNLLAIGVQLDEDACAESSDLGTCAEAALTSLDDQGDKNDTTTATVLQSLLSFLEDLGTSDSILEQVSSVCQLGAQEGLSIEDLTGDLTDSTLISSCTTSYESESGSASADPTPTATPVPSVPDAPTGLTSTDTSATQVDLSWTDAASDETGYTVERSTDNSTWSSLASLAANSTSHSDTTVTAGSTYYYRISADNAGGSSSYATTNVFVVPVPAIASSSRFVKGTAGNRIDKPTGTTEGDVLLFFQQYAAAADTVDGFESIGYSQWYERVWIGMKVATDSEPADYPVSTGWGAVMLRLTGVNTVTPVGEAYSSSFTSSSTPSAPDFAAKVDRTKLLNMITMDAYDGSTTTTAGYSLVEETNDGVGEPHTIVTLMDSTFDASDNMSGASGTTLSAINNGLIVNMALVPPTGEASGSPPELRSSETVNEAMSGATAITAPSGIQDGDLVVLAIGGEDNVTVTLPSGWVELRGDLVGTNDFSYVAYKVAGSSEPATYSFTTSIATTWHGSIMAFSNVDTTTPIGGSASYSFDLGTEGYNAEGPTFTPTKDDTRLIHLSICDDNIGASADVSGVNYRSSVLFSDDTSSGDDFSTTISVSLDSVDSGSATTAYNFNFTRNSGFNCRITTVGINPT